MLSALISWILGGLIAGWLAGKVMKGSGYGVPTDIALGMVDGIVGGVALPAGGDFGGRWTDGRDPGCVRWGGDPGVAGAEAKKNMSSGRVLLADWNLRRRGACAGGAAEQYFWEPAAG